MGRNALQASCSSAMRQEQSFHLVLSNRPKLCLYTTNTLYLSSGLRL